MFVKRSFWAILLLFVHVQTVMAERASLFQLAALPLVNDIDGARPLFEFKRKVDQIEAPMSTASLFLGRAGTSFFAPYPVRTDKFERDIQLSQNALQAIGVRHLIAAAEAGKDGYNAVQHGAKKLPPNLPTHMTIQEIYTWIEDTPGQPHAIGRYQFIPMTLRRLVGILGISGNTVFSSAVQDELADALLVEAGLNAFSDGEIGRHTFMNNMAKIWAGLPTSTGLSYYNGYAGNKATMTWGYFDSEMAKIFPG